MAERVVDVKITKQNMPISAERDATFIPTGTSFMPFKATFNVAGTPGDDYFKLEKLLKIDKPGAGIRYGGSAWAKNTIDIEYLVESLDAYKILLSQIETKFNAQGDIKFAEPKWELVEEAKEVMFADKSRAP